MAMLVVMFLLCSSRVSASAGSGSCDAVSTIQMQVAAFKSKGLPKICEEWNKPDATSCLNECYDQEAASDKADADREMAWGIVGSITGGAGDVFDGMPSKKKKADLLQLAKVESKRFIGMAIAGVGILAGIGNAVSDRESAYASANSQNCEQLGSLLMQQGMLELGNKVDELGNKVDEVNQKVDEVNQKVDESLKKLDLVRQDISAVKTLIGHVEERLTAQLKTLASGQNALMNRADQIMQRVEKLSLLNRRNALNTKMTEFFRCAATISHAFSTLQGAISDKETFGYGFKDVVKGHSDAAEWSKRRETWESNLLPMLGTTAMAALDGMSCMSTLVTTGGLLESYYVELVQDMLRQKLEEKPNAFHVMNDIYKISTRVAAEVFMNDEVLVVSLNAISQLRYVLTSIPREGYWNVFAVYAHNLKTGFERARASMAKTADYMALMKKGLADTMPVLFPPNSRCMAAVGKEHPDAQLTRWRNAHNSNEDVVAGIENLISLTEDQPVDVTKADFYSCSCDQNSSSCTVRSLTNPLDASERDAFGLSGESMAGGGPDGKHEDQFDAAAARRSFTQKLINERKHEMRAWDCRARDFGVRSDAVANFKNCLLAGGSFVEIPTFDCSFETDFCGWNSSAGGERPWSRKSGGTSSVDTGPTGASKHSYYVYTEVSGNFNKIFNLESPKFDASNTFSLSFDYHMRGENIGSLTVQSEQADGTWKNLWEKVGEEGDEWKHASVQVSGAQKVRFQGVSGSSFKGDIAVDDVKASPAGGSAKFCLIQESAVACPKETCSTWLPQCR